MKTLETLRSDADARLRSADFDGALRRYRAILATEPRANDARLGIADALAGLGHGAAAAEVYRAAAWAFAQAGHPLQAILCAKLMSHLDPRGEEDAARIARIFAADSPRVGKDGDRRGPVALEAPAPSTAVLESGPLDEVARAAAAEATELPALSLTIEKFAPAPLLSELDSVWAVELVRAAHVCRLRSGEPCLREGEPPGAVSIVARGRLVLTAGGRPLGYAGGGTLVGEEPLVGAPGAQATAWADGDADLLEIPYEAVATLAKSSVRVEEVLGRLLRSHFLQTLLRASPLFRSLAAADRLELMRRMMPVSVGDRAVLVAEGAPAHGVVLVLSGRAALRVGGEDETALQLVWPGGIVGLASSLSGAPAAANARAVGPTTGLFLEAAALRRLAEAFPEYARDLSGESRERLRAVGKALETTALSDTRLAGAPGGI